jgi:hypothetical protein
VSSQATVERKRSDGTSSAASGRLSVGDYVGVSAAHAAQCVRRAGLRPALERSLGCDPALTGTIVAQEPHAGGEQMRNGMVTLFVAAPGRALGGDASESTTRPEDRASTASRPPDGGPSRSAAVACATGVRRPRKRRLGASAEPRCFDPPPAPVLSAREPHDHGEPGPEDHAPGPERNAQRMGGEQALLLRSERPDLQEAREQARLAEHLQDVFGGRVSEARAPRRLYPRRPITALAQRPVAWAREHRALALAAAAMVLVWLAVVLASATGGHAVVTRGGRAISRADLAVSSSGALPAVRVGRVATGRRRAVAPRRKSSRSRRSLQRRTRARARMRKAHVSEQADGASTPAQATAVVTGSGPAQAQRAPGGPFSP